MSEIIHLKRLQNNCSIALERYVTLAQATCNMLSALRLMPVNKDRRLELFLQRRREEEAHAVYQKARDALLRGLAAQQQLPEIDTVSSVARSSRSPRHNVARHRQAAGESAGSSQDA